MPSQIPPRFLVPVIAACSQLLLKSVSKLFENVEWSNSLLRHFKIQTLLKINCCMTAISAFRVTQHTQIFSLFFRNRIQCIAFYQLHNSRALLNLRRGYFRHLKSASSNEELALAVRVVLFYWCRKEENRCSIMHCFTLMSHQIRFFEH